MVHSYHNSITQNTKPLVDLLFPPSCAVCHSSPSSESQLCLSCAAELTRLPESSCHRCGALISPHHAGRDRCDHCSDPPLKFSRLVCLGQYEGPLRDIILRMKRPSQTALSLAMGKLLTGNRRQNLEKMQPDLLIPIPMHWTRKLRRGVNSPELIAESIARHLSAPSERGVLKLRRNPQIQSSLSPTQRFVNMRGAFRCTAGYAIKGARVLLVDDVLTTGATCSEAAAELRRNGAKEVFVAVISRTNRSI